jgi:DNA-binding Xre family transcriptional regulator
MPKVRCVPDRIVEDAKQRGWSKTHLSKLAGCDRRTVANADGGKLVRLSSVQQIAAALDCSLRELLDTESMEAAAAQDHGTCLALFSPRESDTAEVLPAQALGPAGTAKALVEAGATLFKFRLGSLDEGMRSALGELGALLEAGLGSEEHPFSLQGQMAGLERRERLEEAIRDLAEGGVHVLVSSYPFWRERQWSDLDGNNRSFSSTRHAAAVFVNDPGEKGYVVVDIGCVVPTHCPGDGRAHTHVNGRRLPKRRGEGK